MNMSSSIFKTIRSVFTQPVLYCMIIMLHSAGFVFAADIDDSSLFIEAFTAYQKKDYLLTIEKISIINQLFPDTPLRDVTQLLLARSGLKSGDYELAAKAILRFNSEFAASPLNLGIDEELQRLATRSQKGEKLLPGIPLGIAARKIRNDQLALERATAGESTMVTLPVHAGLPGITVNEPAQHAVKSAISISISEQVKTVGIGQRETVPFEVNTQGVFPEEIVLEAVAPPEYGAVLVSDGMPGQKLLRITVRPGALFKGNIVFHMPPDKVDGLKSVISLRAISEKNQQLLLTHDMHVINSAPLVRVVARPEKLNPAAGELIRYRITVLNVGAMLAKDMSVRVLLPPRMDLSENSDVVPVLYRRDSTGAIIFRIAALESGKLSEFFVDVRVREGTPVGQELRSRIEVVHDQLQTRELFSSTAALVQ